MSEHAADRLSLTLPDWRAALKKRIRRPRRPPVWWTFWCIVMIALAVSNILRARWFYAALDITWLVIYWRGVVRRLPAHILPAPTLLWAALVAVGVAGTVAGLK